MCVHKNVYAYISSKCVQQYVYIYTCVVLSALFLCADDVILLEREKKKDYPIVSLGWTQRKKIFLSHSQAREERKRKRFHSQNTNFSCRFSSPSKHLLLLLGQKRNKNNSSSHNFLFFCLFSSRQNFFARCVWLRQKKERERKAQPARAHANTHTHVFIIIIIKDLLV